MSSTSPSQVARLLALVPYLLRHDGAQLNDVAADFGVGPSQLRKDLMVLQWCGLPQLSYGDYIEIDFDAIDGSGVIHLTNADYFARPLRFSPDEAVALLLALRGLREVADPEQQQVIDTATAKLSTAAGEGGRLAERTDVQVSGGADDVRAAVHRGLREKRQLSLTYDAATRAETTRRLVDPLRASSRDGYAYLDAWCHSAHGLRSFRLDRIVSAEVTDQPVDDHTGLVLPDPGDRWFAGLDDAPVVTLRLAPGAHWVAEYYPAESVSGPDDAHLLTVGFRIADPAWLRTLLLRLGDGVVGVDPPQAADAARTVAGETLAIYAALAGRSLSEPQPSVPVTAPKTG